MLKKGQNLPVRGLYEIGISMFLNLLNSKMKLKIVQTPGKIVKMQFFYREAAFCSKCFLMNKWQL